MVACTKATQNKYLTGTCQSEGMMGYNIRTPTTGRFRSRIQIAVITPAPPTPSPFPNVPLLLLEFSPINRKITPWPAPMEFSQDWSIGTMKGRVTDVGKTECSEPWQNVLLLWKEKMKSGKDSLPNNEGNSL